MRRLRRLRWQVRRLLAEREIRPGDIYEDCAYHPVLCTENYRGDLMGVSLIDGSQPRSCSMFHCGPFKMTPAQVAEAIKEFRETGTPAPRLMPDA